MNYFSLLLTLLLIVPKSFSQKNTTPFTTENVQHLLSRKEVLFQENKGQFTNTRGEQVSDALFKVSASGIDAYITTKGLVYVFSRSIEEETHSKPGVIAGHAENLLPASVSNVEMEWVQVHLEGATIIPENVVKERSGKADYRFFLPHCPDGIMGVKEYEKITVKEVYPGIDWVLYGSSKTGMKYDFIVHPGADPSQIKLRYEGENPVTIDELGNLQVNMKLGTISENAPVSFSGKSRSKVRSAFKSEIVDAHNVYVTYVVDNYPQDQILVIDPQLKWGTRFGATGMDFLKNVTHDSNNNIFIVGQTYSTAFPVMDAGTYYQPNMAGTNSNAIILKFNSSGVLLWSTYYGGGGTSGNNANTVICDGNDNVFIAGETTSASFPLQNSGTFFQATVSGSAVYGEMFILKFDNAGNRLWATYYGGGDREYARSLACDPANNLFVTGYALSSNFPLQDAGTYFQSLAGNYDAFILKFDNAGNRLWGSFYGGTDVDVINAVTCDLNGNVFVTGDTKSTDLPVQDAGTYFDGTFDGLEDIFIAKFDNAGNRLWGTYYGGLNLGSIVGFECGTGIVADANGNIFVNGETDSDDFPVQDAGTYFDASLGQNGGDAVDQFILKFDNIGNRLWATYYGGSSIESSLNSIPTGSSISLDNCGNIYTGFVTLSPDMETLGFGNGSYDMPTYTIASPPCIGFINLFTNEGTLLWASYVGNSGPGYNNIGSCLAIDVDNNNNVYMVGLCKDTGPSDLSVNPGNGAYFDASVRTDEDGYILKFIPDVVQYSSSQTPAGCDCSGTATVTASGGIGPYSYTWSNGTQTVNTDGVTNAVGQLCAGLQWVEIVSCNNVDTVYITLASGADCKEDFSIEEIPNVIVLSSKNGNNVFYVDTKGVTKFNCTIVNRWGNPIYEYSDPKESWDGTTNGVAVEEGTYFYHITGTTNDNDEFSKQGFIEVFR